MEPQVALMSEEEKAEVIESFRSLSAREAEILALIVGAYEGKEIARELGIAYRTVEKHREKILLKMAARNSLELVRMTIEARCLPS